MNNLVNFIIESGISLSLLALIYILFLRKETFFRLNRIFLLISIVFSIVLPFLKFRVYDPQPVMLAEITVTPYRNLMEAVTVYGRDFSGTVEQTISSSRIIIMIYLIGLMFFFGRFIFRLAQILLLIHKNQVQKSGLVKFVSIKKEFSPFSFLSYVFVNPDLKSDPGYEKMVAHEMEHIKQGHSFDVLILELLTVFQWFNPFMWILRRVIRENHEYLADQAVLKAGISPAHYKHLLLNQAVGFQLKMANNFNSSLIKKRIKMISKIHSSKYGKFKIVLGLLVIFGLITAFSLEEKTSAAKKKEKALVLNLDEQIARNTEELQYITGVVDNSPTNQAALDKLKENYQLDYRYGIYNVSWKRDYENGVFFIDGQESSFEEMKKLEAEGKRKTIAGIGGGKDLEPFLEKYGEKAKNGVNFVYSEISHEEIFPTELPVAATKLTVQDVLDRHYKKGSDLKSKSAGEQIIVNVDGKKMQISGTNVSLEDVSKLLLCNDIYDVVVLRESKTINLLPAKNKGKQASSTSDGEPIFFVVEEMPEYPGGEMELKKYIANEIKYPLTAKEKGIQGKVYITFVVGKDGSVKDAKIARGVNSDLDKEALRVINGLPKWKPGKQRGTPVNVSYTVPINFALNDVPAPPKVVEVISTVTSNEKQNDVEAQVFYIVEKMPEFPGGETALRSFIANTIKYPEIAMKNGIQGKVYVTFIVGSDGSVKDAKIARGVDPSLDIEALRVVNLLPIWKPGYQKGVAVNVSYTVPINFALQ